MSECQENRPVNNVFTSTGVILVLFILLVIISRTFV
ncbi:MULTISPECIES: sporulation protein YjcZ [Paenibacillus]|nr:MULTISPECIES: sporulation protein YjcZ [Paenibacillus]